MNREMEMRKGVRLEGDSNCEFMRAAKEEKKRAAMKMIEEDGNFVVAVMREEGIMLISVVESYNRRHFLKVVGGWVINTAEELNG